MREPVEGLCGSCNDAHIRTNALGKRIVVCTALRENELMTQPVVSCTSFSAKGTLDQHSMFQIAWTLESKEGRVIGFKPPRRPGEY